MKFTFPVSACTAMLLAACDGEIELNDLFKQPVLSEYVLRVIPTPEYNFGEDKLYQVRVFSGATTAETALVSKDGVAAAQLDSEPFNITDFVKAATADTITITLAVSLDLDADQTPDAFEPATTATFTLHRAPVVDELKLANGVNFQEEFTPGGVKRGVFVVSATLPGMGGVGKESQPLEIEEGKLYTFAVNSEQSTSFFQVTPSKDVRYAVIYSNKFGQQGGLPSVEYGLLDTSVDSMAAVFTEMAITAGEPLSFSLKNNVGDAGTLSVAVMPIPEHSDGASTAYVAIDHPDYAVAPIEGYVMNSVVTETTNQSSHPWVPAKMEYKRTKEGAELNDPLVVFGSGNTGGDFYGYLEFNDYSLGQLSYFSPGGQVFDLSAGSCAGWGFSPYNSWVSTLALVNKTYRAPETQFAVCTVGDAGITIPIIVVTTF